MKNARLIPWLAVAALAHGASPPPTTLPSKAVPSQRPAATEEIVAYVGVATLPVPAALRAQLDLPRGVGVIVDAVEPDGPAARAGLAVHDVVTHFDDQIVCNVQQLGCLVALRRGGETATVAVVRGGKPVAVSVVLGEHSVPIADAGQRLSSIVTHNDGEHVITLTTHGTADRHVRIADPAGHVIYDGPLNTPEELAKLPENCRAKVDAVEKKFEWFKRLRAATAPAMP